MAQWEQTGLDLRGPEGPRGPKGEPGEDGAGVSIAGQVATYADLPTGLGADDTGRGWLVEDDGRLYVFTGERFPADGHGVEFRGPPGEQGERGQTGPRGERGETGSTGDTGPAGTAATIRVGHVATGVAGSSATVNNTGTSSTAVFDFSIPSGAKGDTGAQGTPGVDGTAGPRGSLWFTGTSLPSSGMQTGDLFLNIDDGTVYRYQ